MPGTVLTSTILPSLTINIPGSFHYLYLQWKTKFRDIKEFAQGHKTSMYPISEELGYFTHFCLILSIRVLWKGGSCEPSWIPSRVHNMTKHQAAGVSGLSASNFLTVELWRGVGSRRLLDLTWRAVYP